MIGTTPWQMAQHLSRVAEARDLVLDSSLVDDPLCEPKGALCSSWRPGQRPSIEIAAQDQVAASGIPAQRSDVEYEQNAAQSAATAGLAADLLL